MFLWRNKKNIIRIPLLIWILQKCYIHNAEAASKSGDYIVFFIAHTLQNFFDFFCNITKTRLFKYTENYTNKTENFQIKKSDIFHISVLNIDCGYSLEPP